MIKYQRTSGMVSTFPTAISLVIVHPTDGLLNMDSLAVFSFNSNQVRVLIIDLDSAILAESFSSNTFKA
jgi:hypothetical protein